MLINKHNDITRRTVGQTFDYDRDGQLVMQHCHAEFSFIPNQTQLKI